MDPSNPLAEGHVRGYEIDNDPSSSTYGQVLYNGSTDFGGALWDGGTLLVSRPATASEYNEEDRDGFGKRDIPSSKVVHLYCRRKVIPIAAKVLIRVLLSAGILRYLGLILDTSDTTYDLNEDGSVNSTDLQTPIDFARGLPTANYPYLDVARGTWKVWGCAQRYSCCGDDRR